MTVDSFIEKYKKYNISKSIKNIVIKFNHSQIFDKQFFEDIIDMINDIKNIDNFDPDSIDNNNFKFNFVICDNAINYSKEQKERVYDLKNMLNSNNIACYFRLGGANYSFEEVENANKQIKEIAVKIKSQKLSPLEQLLSVYFLITKKSYNEALSSLDSHLPRTIYGVLNTKYIVCVGYSELFEAIMQQINPNIKIHQNSVEVNRGRHSNLIVHIVDKKYNINGLYILDPTIDNRAKKQENLRMNLFAIPLCDYDNFNITEIFHTDVDIFTEREYTSLDDGINKNLLETFRKCETLEGNISLKANKGYIGKTTLLDLMKDEMIKNTVVDFYNEYITDNIVKMEEMSAFEYDEQKLKRIEQNINTTYEKIRLIGEDRLNNINIAYFYDDIIKAISYLSAPIPLKFMKNAVKTYIKTNNPQLTEEELNTQTNSAIQLNIDRSLKFFNENAKNCFAQIAYKIEKTHFCK